MGVRVTQIAVESIEARSSTARITQVVIETIEERTPVARVTQYFVEIIKGARLPTDYPDSVDSSIIVSQDITFDIISDTSGITVNHTIAVGSNVAMPIFNEVTVEHSIAVSQLLDTAHNVLQTVTSAITVTQTITKRSTVPRITVNTPVAVAQTITPRNNVTRQTVTSSVAVTPLIIVRGRDIFITVSHSIGVAQLITFRNTVIRISVTSSIAASDTEDEHNSVNRQTIEQSVTIISDSRGQNDRMSVVDTVLVTSTATGRNSNLRKTQLQSVHVTQVITAMNPRIKVTQSIGVGQTITARSNIIRKTVNSVITVSDHVVFSTTFVNMTVVDTIDIPQYYQSSWPATARVSPTRVKNLDLIEVGTAIFGGSDNRAITVVDLVTVVDTVRLPEQYATVFSKIKLEDSFTGGNSNREISVEDVILLTDLVANRTSPNKQIINDTILITTTRTAKGPIVPITVNQSIYVDPKITPRPLEVQRVISLISVKQVARSSDNRQLVNDTLLVSQRPRSTPVRITVNQDINLSQRSSDIYIIMRNVINVGSKFWNQQDIDLVDTLPIEQTLDRQIERTRELTDELPIVQTLNRFAIWTQNLTDTLVFPENTFPKQFSFWPYPIDVPVFHGGLMSNLVVLECENDAITLPAALLGDTKSNVDKIIVQRSMNAKTLTIISSSDRQKLTLKFRISLMKSYELRKFVMDHQSGMIRMTDWNGANWVGRFTSNPFIHTHAGRSTTEQEYVTFDIGFEGVKIAG